MSKTKVQNTNGVKLNGCSLEYRYIDVRDEDIEGKSSHPTCLPALIYVICWYVLYIGCHLDTRPQEQACYFYATLLVL